jgi:hypothetical protein
VNRDYSYTTFERTSPVPARSDQPELVDYFRPRCALCTSPSGDVVPVRLPGIITYAHVDCSLDNADSVR